MDKTEHKVRVIARKHPLIAGIIEAIMIIAVYAVYVLFCYIPIILLDIRSKTQRGWIILVCMVVFFVIFMIVYGIYEKYRDYMMVDSDFNMIIKNKRVQLNFNLLQLYKSNKVKITNRTYSNTVQIKIKDVDGYRVKIEGDNIVRDRIVTLCDLNSVKLEVWYDDNSD